MKQPKRTHDTTNQPIIKAKTDEARNPNLNPNRFAI
jgi:hypothetical protein